jgi:DNA-binding phage protein
MHAAGVEALAKKRAKPPGPEPRDPIAAKLRALVDARKGDRSEAEIARAAHMSRQALHRLLAGSIRDPKFETVRDVLAAIGATLTDLDRA